MGRAIKCDNCKKLIEETNQDRTVKGVDRELVIEVKAHYDWARNDNLDICDDCLKDLLPKFLEAK